MSFRWTAAITALAISAFVPSLAGASDAQVQDQLQQMQQRMQGGATPATPTTPPKP